MPPEDMPFYNKEVAITNTQNAIFSALAVILAFCIIHLTGNYSNAGFFVVAMQSVSGINSKVSFKKKLGINLQVRLILIITVAAAIFTKGSLAFTIIGALLLSFSFAYWRKLFQNNWPDIIIPTGVIFIMGLTAKSDSNPIMATVQGGVIAFILELLIGIILILFWQQPKAAPPGTVIANWKFVLERPLFIYALELSFLFIAGLLIIHTNTYSHGYWMIYTAIVVLQVSQKGTLKKIWYRTLGTLTGCVAGSALLLLHPPPLVQIGILATAIFLFLFYVHKNYAFSIVFITIYVLLLLGTNNTNPYSITLERTGYTIAGGLLATFSSLLFLSRKELV